MFRLRRTTFTIAQLSVESNNDLYQPEALARLITIKFDPSLTLRVGVP
jgi:hypothetical protein